MIVGIHNMQKCLFAVVAALAVGIAQPMDFSAPKTSLSAQEKKQWQYISDTLNVHVIGAKKNIRMLEKVFKYVFVPGAPLLLLAINGWCNLKLEMTLMNKGAQPHYHPILHILCYGTNYDIRQAWDGVGFVLCAGGFLVSASLYVLFDKIFSIVSKSKNYDAIKNLLTEWRQHRECIPVALHPLIRTLYQEFSTGTLTHEKSSKAVAALLALSSVALTQKWNEEGL